MKRFMYLSVGVLCLMLSALVGFHMGNQTAQAQAPGMIVGTFSDSNNHYVMLDNGDVYFRTAVYDGGYTYDHSEFGPAPLHYVGNFWTGADGTPVPTEQKTWGGVKGKK